MYSVTYNLSYGTIIMTQEKFPLPDELHTKIFSYLDPASLQQVAFASKAMQRIAMDDSIWKAFIRPDLPNTETTYRAKFLKSIKVPTPEDICTYPYLTPRAALQLIYSDVIDVLWFNTRSALFQHPSALFDELITQCFRGWPGSDQCRTIKMLACIGREVYETGIKPIDFSVLDISLFRLIATGFATKLFVELGLKPQDVIGLNSNHIAAFTFDDAGIRLLQEYEQTPQDWIALDHNQMLACNSSGGEVLFKNGLVKPSDFKDLKSEQIYAIMHSSIEAAELFKDSVKPHALATFLPLWIELLFRKNLSIEEQKAIISNPPAEYTMEAQEELPFWATEEYRELQARVEAAHLDDFQ